MMLQNKFIRFSVAATLAFSITLALLLLMQTLIHMKAVDLQQGAQKLADIYMGDTEIEVQRKNQKPEKPEQPPEPPEPIELDQLVDAQVDTDALNIRPNLGVDLNIQGPGLNVSDGEYLPFVKVQPQYPRRAQSRGIQGTCTVAYTVTKQGTTRDIRVVDCSSSLFERASIQAAAKFKYKPRIVDGQAVEVPNVKNRFNYKLQ